MAQITTPETFVDGQTVNAARLNNIVGLATALPGLVHEQPPVTPVTGDELVIYQTSSGGLKRATVGDVVHTVAAAAPPASVQGNSSSPAGTTAAYPGVMAGVFGSITPMSSGNILFSISGSAINDTLACGVQVQLRYGTGTKPAPGAPLIGVPVGGLQSGSNPTTGVIVQVSISLSAVVSGLAVGTFYWLDASINAEGGGTAYLQNVAICAHEF